MSRVSPHRGLAVHVVVGTAVRTLVLYGWGMGGWVVGGCYTGTPSQLLEEGPARQRSGPVGPAGAGVVV